MNLYQIYDRKSEQVIGMILREHRDAAAIRVFGDVLSNKDTAPGQHPEDFDLIYLGYQSPEGTIDAEEEVRTVITGTQWLAAQQKPQTADLSLFQGDQ